MIVLVAVRETNEVIYEVHTDEEVDLTKAEEVRVWFERESVSGDLRVRHYEPVDSEILDAWEQNV